MPSLRLRRSYEKIFAALCLTKSDKKVFYGIYDAIQKRGKGKDRIQASIADVTKWSRGVSQATVKRSLNRLEEVELIRRERSPESNRHVKTTIILLCTSVPPKPSSGNEPSSRLLKASTHVAPIRYPGSKGWLIPTFVAWLRAFTEQPEILVEPFAGGASVGLAVAYLRLVTRVVLVERSVEIAAFWRTIIEDPGGCEWLVEKTVRLGVSPGVPGVFHPWEGVNLSSAIKYWTEYCTPKDDRERALRVLLNSYAKIGGIQVRPGTIKPGSRGEFKERWKPDVTVSRLGIINLMRSRLQIIEGDGLDQMRKWRSKKDVAWFIDCPYPRSMNDPDPYKRLYEQPVDQDRLFAAAAKLEGPWLMTNEDSEEIHALIRRYGFDPQQRTVNTNMGDRKPELLIGRSLPAK